MRMRRTITSSDASIVGSTEKEIDGNVSKFNGSFVIGVGAKISNPLYVSIEAGLEAGPPAKQSIYGSSTGGARLLDLEITHKSLSPWLALRMGLVWENILTYLKAGGKQSKVEEHYLEYDATHVGRTSADSTNKISGISPFVCLGVEKYFAKKASVRFEIEYDFGTNKSKNWGDVARSGSTKFTQKDTISLRVIFVCNLKIDD